MFSKLTREVNNAKTVHTDTVDRNGWAGVVQQMVSSGGKKSFLRTAPREKMNSWRKEGCGLTPSGSSSLGEELEEGMAEVFTGLSESFGVSQEAQEKLEKLWRIYLKLKTGVKTSFFCFFFFFFGIARKPLKTSRRESLPAATILRKKGGGGSVAGMTKNYYSYPICSPPFLQKRLTAQRNATAPVKNRKGRLPKRKKKNVAPGLALVSSRPAVSAALHLPLLSWFQDTPHARPPPRKSSPPPLYRSIVLSGGGG